MAQGEAYFDPEIHCISLNKRKLDHRLPTSPMDYRLAMIFSTQNTTIARSKVRSKLNTELTMYDPYLEFSIRLGRGNVETHKKLVMKKLGEKVTPDQLGYYASAVTKGKTQWVWANIDRLDYWNRKARHGYDVIDVLRDILHDTPEWR